MRWITVVAMMAVACCVAAAGDRDPWSEVEVVTDTSGVPHVLAETEDALWYAAGYVYTDRMGRFEPYLAQRARGRMAELLGSEALDGDVQIRLTRVAERPDSRGRLPMEKGSSHVMVAQMTDLPRVWSVKPFGNNNDPASPHYADLTELFAAGELRQVWLERAEIAAHAESVLGRGVSLTLPGGIGVVRSTSDHVVELAALAEDGRVTIEEIGGRPFSARLELGDSALFVLTPFPKRGGKPEEFASLVEEIITNPMFNAETIRLDAGMRMGAR